MKLTKMFEFKLNKIANVIDSLMVHKFTKGASVFGRPV